MILTKNATTWDTTCCDLHNKPAGDWDLGVCSGILEKSPNHLEPKIHTADRRDPKPWDFAGPGSLTNAALYSISKLTSCPLAGWVPT